MSDERLRRFLLRAAAAAAAAALLYVLLCRLLVWLLPFLFAALCAAAMEPAVRFLQTRLRFRRAFASLVLTLFLLFLLGGLFSFLGATLTAEAQALLGNAPALLDAAQETLAALSARVTRFGTAFPPRLQQLLAAALSRAAGQTETLFERFVVRLPSAIAALAAALPGVLLGSATSLLAVYFTSASLPELRALPGTLCSAQQLQRLERLRSGLSRSASRWLRAELTLCAVTFAEVLSGLLLLRQPYALLLALCVTAVDALPVFGTGTVLLPWAGMELLLRNCPRAAALAALYLVTLTVRNVLEPRLLGAQAGLPPILSLLAMYLGYCAFGVTGMLICPFLLLLGAQLRRQAKK